MNDPAIGHSYRNRMFPNSDRAIPNSDHMGFALEIMNHTILGFAKLCISWGYKAGS